MIFSWDQPVFVQLHVQLQHDQAQWSDVFNILLVSFCFRHRSLTALPALTRIVSSHNKLQLQEISPLQPPCCAVNTRCCSQLCPKCDDYI